MFIFLFSSFRLTSISVDSDFFAYSYHDFCNTSFCPISALSEQSVFDFCGFPAFFRMSFDEVRRLRAFPPMRTATSINATDAGRHFQSAFYRVFPRCGSLAQFPFSPHAPWFIFLHLCAKDGSSSECSAFESFMSDVGGAGAIGSLIFSKFTSSTLSNADRAFFVAFGILNRID